MMETIRSILPKVLSSLGLETWRSEEKIREVWPDLVGEKIAAHATPARLRGKILIVDVDNSVWAHQLSSSFGRGITEKINGKMGERIVAEVRFKVAQRGRKK